MGDSERFMGVIITKKQSTTVCERPTVIVDDAGGCARDYAIILGTDDAVHATVFVDVVRKTNGTTAGPTALTTPGRAAHCVTGRV